MLFLNAGEGVIKIFSRRFRIVVEIIDDKVAYRIRKRCLEMLSLLGLTRLRLFIFLFSVGERNIVSASFRNDR